MLDNTLLSFYLFFCKKRRKLVLKKTAFALTKYNTILEMFFFKNWLQFLTEKKKYNYLFSKIESFPIRFGFKHKRPHH